MWKVLSVASAGKYNYARVPSHPNCNSRGYVLEHRIVVENNINKLLDKDEDVHHKNGNGKDNRIENLEVISHSKHAKLHNPFKPRILVNCAYCNTQLELSGRNYRYRSKNNKLGFFCNQSCSTYYQWKIKRNRE